MKNRKIGGKEKGRESMEKRETNRSFEKNEGDMFVCQYER